MKAEIKEEGILELKALTLTKGIFKQLEQVTGEDIESYLPFENAGQWNPANWVGYVLEHWTSSAGDAQTDWYLIVMEGKLKRIRGIDLFFVMRSQLHPNPTKDLQNMLKQVFLK